MKSSLPFRFVAPLALALWTLSSGEAHACACCSDPGSYYLRTDKISDFELSQLPGLEFAKAEIFTTDAHDGPIPGIKSELGVYTVKAKLEGKQWTLSFRAEDGKTGTLKLSVPTKLTDFAVDIHDGKKSAGGGPLLYKEWRMEGTVTGSGIFHMAKARYSLVLQGRGNNCDDGSDFYHWRIAVTGKNIDYSFHGALVQEGGHEEPAAEDEAKEPAPAEAASPAPKPDTAPKDEGQ